MVARIAVIIVNWNGWSDTIACLQSLMRLETNDFSIFVCDNASTDSSVEQIRVWAAESLPKLSQQRLADGKNAFVFSEIAYGSAPMSRGTGQNLDLAYQNTLYLINTGQNRGFAGGNNVGLRHALANSFNLFWILNNDTEVMPDSLTHLIQRMAENPNIGMCGSTLVYAAEPNLVQNLGGGRFSPIKGKAVALGFQTRLNAAVNRDEIEASLTFVSGASMLVSRAFVKEIGLMSEEYFLYFEEPDWAERARGRFKLGFAPLSIVRHKVGASIGTNDFGGMSRLSLYYQNRNRVRFCWRFYWIALPFTYIDLCREILRAVLSRDLSRVETLVRATLGLPFGH